MKLEPSEIVRVLSRFTGADLTQTLGRIEGSVRGMTVDDCSAFLAGAGAEREVEYQLTDLGSTLSEAFCGVWNWADQNLAKVEAARRAFDKRASEG